jgi:hypothetical protein
MNQYTTKKKVPVLLQNSARQKNSVNLVNGMVELTIDGERTVVPSADAFQRLMKKVAVLEQRLASTDNKASRAARTKRNDGTV